MRVLLLAWFACALATDVGAEPRRIVSLDYCADQFVLALADRDQIVALSRGSRREDSYFRARAGGIRQTRGTLEEVLALQPDLVVRNWGGPWNAEEAYARFGVSVLQVGDTPDFVSAREDLVDAGRALGRVERAEALARDLDARLDRLERTAQQPSAVMYLSAGGAVAGAGTMMDAVISAAGGQNISTGAGWTVMPLERLVATPPALIALGFFDTTRTRMNAWSPSRHPALRRALANARTVSLPIAPIACESWYAIDAAEAIAAGLRAP